MSTTIITEDDQGPTGPPPVTSLTLPFTMPPADGTTQVTATVGNASFLIGGATLSVQNAGAGGLNGVMRVFATPLAGATSVQLVNPVGSNNVASGTAVPAASQIAPSGALGPPGPSAFTTVSAPGFTMPAQDGTTPVSIPMGNSTWSGIGAFIFVATSGWLQVTGLPDALHVTAVNPTGITQLATPGTVIAAGVSVTAAGAKGPQGLVGSPGPVQLSVVDAAALTATSTVPFLAGAQAYVRTGTAAKTDFIYDPTSVLTPDGINVVAAQGGGNWVSIASLTNPGVLGTSQIGTATYGEYPLPGSTQPLVGVGAGQTAAVFTLPTPLIRGGEMITLSCRVMLQANLAATVITLATNASPAVCTLTSTAGLATGDVIFIFGALGNTAINGAFYYSLSGSQITLYRDAALTIPVAGNGAYTGGAFAQSMGFAHFERTITLRDCRGIVINAQGSQADSDLTFPIAPGNTTPSLASATVAIAVSGGTLVLNVTAPGTVPILATFSVSSVRVPLAGVGPAPTIISADVIHGPDTGGTVTHLTGTGFTGAAQVLLDGIPAASFSVQSDGALTATSAAGSAGTGSIVVITANGSGSNVAVQWTYDATPIGIMGGASVVRFYGDGSSIQQTAGVVTAWNDKSGNANHLLNGTVGSSAPVYTASDTHVSPNAPSVTFDGVKDYLTKTVFNLGPAGAPVFFWVIARATKSAVVCKLCHWQGGGTNYVYISTGSAILFYAATALAASGVQPVLNTSVAIGTSVDGTPSGGNISVDAAIGAAAPATATAAYALTNTATGQVSVAADAAPSNFYGGQVFVFMVCNVRPTTPQRAALELWAQQNTGVA